MNCPRGVSFVRSTHEADGTTPYLPVKDGTQPSCHAKLGDS